MAWFIYDRNLCHEREPQLVTNFRESEDKKENNSHDISIFMNVSTNGWKSHLG